MKEPDYSGARDELAQKGQSWDSVSNIACDHAGRVATGASQAGDEPQLNRIAAGREYDRYCRRGSLRWRNRNTVRKYRRNLAAHEISRQCRQPVVLVLGKPVFDREIAPFVIAHPLETLAKGSEQMGVRSLRSAREKTHHGPWLLRARRQRQGGCRAAEEGEERAAVHRKSSVPEKEGVS